MQLRPKKVLTSILFGGFLASSALAADDIKYAAIQKEDGIWKVVSITETIPAYQEGMEILSVPTLMPQFDKRFKAIRSQYGGIECPSVPDKSMYSPCTSYFYRFVGANWFGLGGIRVSLIPERLAEVRSAIAANETIAAMKAKADEAAEKQAQAAREAERLKIAKIQEQDNQEEKSRNLQKQDNLLRMAKAERGAEDSCKRILNPVAGPGGAWVIAQKDPEIANVKCQFGGEVTLQGLPNAGWLVVNKMRDSDGMVTEYYIRKAR